MAPTMKAALATLALCPGPALASFKVACQSMAFAYMDPIVTPGARAGHEHSIGGSLGFADTTVTSWMAGNQSSCDTPGDFSNYWVASLMRTDLGPPQRLTPFLSPYYQFNAQDTAKMNVSIFANLQNISMVVGDADGQTPLSSHINILCKQNDVKVVSPVRGWHPSVTNCDELRIDFVFPSCWNGQPYSSNQSHVAYQVWDRVKQWYFCPATHPFEFPEVRLEQRYPLDVPVSWTNGSAPFVFSSGGIETAHADATLVWDTAAMTNLVTKCTGMTINCDTKAPEIVRKTLKEQVAIAAAYTVPPQYQ